MLHVHISMPPTHPVLEEVYSWWRKTGQSNEEYFSQASNSYMRDGDFEKFGRSSARKHSAQKHRNTKISDEYHIVKDESLCFYLTTQRACSIKISIIWWYKQKFHAKWVDCLNCLYTCMYLCTNSQSKYESV